MSDITRADLDAAIAAHVADEYDGDMGKDGRGIETLTCDDAGIWQVTFTDGTTASAGACRTIIPPEEQP